jgi:hypothetical protein
MPISLIISINLSFFVSWKGTSCPSTPVQECINGSF